MINFMEQILRLGDVTLTNKNTRLLAARSITYGSQDTPFTSSSFECEIGQGDDKSEVASRDS